MNGSEEAGGPRKVRKSVGKMTNQLSKPPDRAETVHYNRSNRFWTCDNEIDDEWRTATNEASDIAAITVIIEALSQNRAVRN